MTITEPVTIRHRVGDCPACRSGLWAEVQLAAYVGAPTIDRDGKGRVFASPHFLGAQIVHSCRREGDGEWTYGDEAGEWRDRSNAAEEGE